MIAGLEVTAAVTQGGGIGRYVRELLKALAKSQTSHQFRLFYAAPQPNHPLPHLPDNFTLRQLPFHDIWLARAWHRLQLSIPVQTVIGPVDLYHSPDFLLPPVADDIPTVLTVHDLSFVRDRDTASPGLRDFLDANVPRSVERATHVLADSAQTRDDLVALYDTPPDKVSVLYPGVEERFIPVNDLARESKIRERYGLGPDPYILAVSTIQPRKNYQRLIAAFDDAFRDSNVNLVFAGGKGWLYNEIFAEAENRELGYRVKFIGFADDEDLPALYSFAAMLAYPSLYEGFGLPMVEAMACGTPVLAARASCLPEVAGNAAFMVDPLDVADMADGLQRLLFDDVLRLELREKGLARAAQFSWMAAAQQLLDLYTTLVE